MNKILTLILLSITIILVLVAVILQVELLYSYGIFGKAPQIGEIWCLNTCKPDNPFCDDKIWYVKVIDINNGYVKYVYCDKNGVKLYDNVSDNSSTISIFRRIYNKLE